MATKTKKEETKEVEIMEEELDVEVEETEAAKETETGSTEPEKKETLGTKAKNLGGKVLKGVKKALPYVGAFAAGAGAAVGALIVMTRPDGSELEALPMDDSLVPAEDFIEGEAEVVEESDAE